jgi:hypothetical protein
MAAFVKTQVVFSWKLAADKTWMTNAAFVIPNNNGT